MTKIKGGLILPNNPIQDYLFGSSSSPIDNQIIMPSGDWTDYRPNNERQKKFFDTWCCTSFSALNAIETFFNYLIKNKLISTINYEWLVKEGYIENGMFNASDRFVGYTSGTKVGVGNTASNVARAIHSNGLVPERLWNFTDYMDEDEYFKRPPEELLILGLEFLKRFKIIYEQIWMKDRKEALKYAPLQVFVNAWYQKNGVYYNPNGKINHAVMMMRTTTKQIFDSYDPFIKTLSIDYNYFASGYKYSVVEIINHMNVEEFIKENDLLFVRNTKTGQFGRIMQGELKVVNTDDRGTLMLLDDAVRRNGRGLSEEEWDILPKSNF